MSEPFYLLFGVEDLSSVPLNYFIEFRKYCSSRDDLSAFIERVDQSALNRFSVQLLEAIIKLLDDFEGYQYDEMIFRRTKTLIHIFMHLAGKSLRFCESAVCHSIAHWTMLLRVEFIRTEALMSLSFLCRHLYRATLTEDTFTHMLSDLATWWNQVSLQNEHRNFIADCFKKLLENEYLFLQHCQSTMDRDSFLDVLFLAESLMVEPSVHPNKKRARRFDLQFDESNVRFCVDYFEQLDREFAEVPLEFLFRAHAGYMGLGLSQSHNDIGLRMFLLTSIISSAALYRPDYEDSLHDEQRAIRLICGLLKVLLEVEEIRRREIEAQKATASLSRQRSQASLEGASTGSPTKAALKPKPCSVSPEKSARVVSETSADTSAGELSNEPTVTSTRKNSDTVSDSSNKPPVSSNAGSGNETTTGNRDADESIRQGCSAAASTALLTPAKNTAADSLPANVCLKSSNQLRLVLLKRQIATHVAAGLRETSVRAIGNLCTRSRANQLAAGVQFNAIPMLLRCAMKIDADKPQIPQKATHALTMLCADCIENQERLLAALDLTGNVVDRTQLLATLGFKPEIEEETGKIIRLSPLPPGTKISRASLSSSSSSSSSGSSNGAMAEEDEEEEEDEDSRVPNNCDEDEEEEEDEEDGEEDDEDEEEKAESSVIETDSLAAVSCVIQIDQQRSANASNRKRQTSAEPAAVSKRSKSIDGHKETERSLEEASISSATVSSIDNESSNPATLNNPAVPAAHLNATSVPLS